MARACYTGGSEDISARVRSEYLQWPAGSSPGALCKRALAYSIRMLIIEIDADGRTCTWEPEFAGKSYTRADNLNRHDEYIKFFPNGSGEVILVYPKETMLQYPAIEKANRLILQKMRDFCAKCGVSVAPGDKDRFELLCGHIYHRKCLKQHVAELTQNMYVLTEEETMGRQISCAAKRCCQPEISPEKVRELLGPAEYEECANNMNSRAAVRIVVLKCCSGRVDASKLKIAALFDFARGTSIFCFILSSVDEKAKYIACPAERTHPLQESDLRLLVGPERFSGLLRETCGVCGKLERRQLAQQLECTHTICADCILKELIKDQSRIADIRSLAYVCRICGAAKRLGILAAMIEV